MYKEQAVEQHFSKVTQVGIVVRDLDEAVERLTAFGLGPFGSGVLPPFKGMLTYKGKSISPDTPTVRASICWIGDFEVEILQPFKGKSTYKEFLDNKGEGIHHIALAVDNFDKELNYLENKGFNSFYFGRYTRGGFAYYDIGIGDIFLELIERGVDINKLAIPKSKFPKVIQAGAIVKDINRAGEHLKAFGLGTFRPQILKPFVDSTPVFRGKPISAEVKSWVSYLGDFGMELILPIKGFSPWHEFLNKRGEGIHHIALAVDDLDKQIGELEKIGFNSFCSGKWEGGGFAYFDVGLGGLIFELLKF
jgi:catechol 2,3-dioxygenase-like lactoylglutathione lyase family enzyme